MANATAYGNSVYVYFLQKKTQEKYSTGLFCIFFNIVNFLTHVHV